MDYATLTDESQAHRWLHLLGIIELHSGNRALRSAHDCIFAYLEGCESGCVASLHDSAGAAIRSKLFHQLV